MKTYLPDSNFFLEFRWASDLPWQELESDASAAPSDVRLLIPPTVITEIDRFKTRGNDRKAKRARDVSALFRKALLDPHHQAILRDANPRILVELPPVFSANFGDYPTLDSKRNDH
jgi:hypothetical protein